MAAGRRSRVSLPTSLGVQSENVFVDSEPIPLVFAAVIFNSDFMPFALSPQGAIHFDEHQAQSLDSRTEQVVRKAAAQGSPHLLLHLATKELDTALPPAGVFWRNLARRYLTQLCHTPDVTAETSLAPPPEVELARLVDSAPPMLGAEYLSVGTLQSLWQELDALVLGEVRVCPGGAAAWLKARNPLWNLVGRVTFHLAENKRDGERPFAFLATYTHRISDQAKPQYLPLGRALQEYAGTRNRAALLSLLAPVQRAAEKSPLVRELVDSQRVYHAQSWTAREAHRFLREIPLFEECGLLVRMPAWGKRLSRPAVSVAIGSKKPEGLGLGAVLDFQVSLTLDGEALSAEEWKQILRNEEGLVQIRGRWAEVDRDKLQRVLDHWKTLEKAHREEGISFAEGLRLLSGVREDSEDTDPVAAWSNVRAGDWLEKTLSALRSPDADADPSPPALLANLRPYQRAGVHWLRFLTRLRLGACLADDMGLGKTVQVLGMLLHWRTESPAAPPALLILPASLLGNWLDEARRFAPSLRMLAVHPSAEKEPDRALPNVDVVLTTYGMVSRLEWLRHREWSFVILDEAQAIKNPGARQAKAVKQLKAPARVALTGTPVENSLGDLWSLFDFLNPGLLGSASDFSRRVRYWSDASRAGASFGPLRRLVRPYILRRLKSDKSVIADLPDKTEMRALCSLTKRQAALYEQSVRELKERLETAEDIQRRGLILALLMRLKQLCNHPAQWVGNGDYDPGQSGKFQRLGELAAEIASRQEKALIFTQFREMTGPLQHFLTAVFGRSGLVLHGNTGVKDRRALVGQFQREDGPPFFVLSLKAGGTGLNLTEAQHVIHFDRWWNPAVENQATDRAYRIGQKKNVLVHKFVCRGTVEERIHSLLEEKQALASELLADGGEIALTEMKNDELLRFVSLDVNSAVDGD